MIFAKHATTARLRALGGVSLKLPLAAVLATTAACTHAVSSSGAAMSAAPSMSVAAPSPDPRVGLKAGLWDAGEAAWNMRLLSNTHPPQQFSNAPNSDLAFFSHYAIQGNFNGYQIWDITNPTAPKLAE